MNRSSRYLLLGLLAALLGASPAGPPRVVLDPALRCLLARSPERDRDVLRTAQDPSARPPLPRGLAAALPLREGGTLELFLETEGNAPGGEGVEAVAMGEGLYAARVTFPALRRLLNEGGIASARLARPLRPALDRSGPYLGLSQIRQMDSETGAFAGATGRGVLIGIADSGVDWAHPDFQDAAGRTRLIKYWDQTEPFGTPPSGYSFGAEYTAGMIDFGMVPARDVSGHGTHVLGIAAGNGLGSRRNGQGVRYPGVAPEAALVAVRTNFTEVGVAHAVRYIFQQADALGIPAVVNLSLGNHYGPHRGDTPFERALQSTLGPGRLVVAAAGNDGQRALHAELRQAAGNATTLRVEFPEYAKDPGQIFFIDLEAWFDPRARHSVTVLDPEGNPLGPFLWGDEQVEFSSPRGIARGWNTEDAGRGTILIEIEDNPDSPRRAVGVWTLRVETAQAPEQAEIDWWVVNWRSDPGTMPAFLDAVDPEETVLSPATAPGILAVGAISTRACWTDAEGEERCYAALPQVGDVAAFTSRGPTADGRDKPELYAPGYGVVSARSAVISPAIWTAEELRALSSPDGLYWTSQGTSMAAPQVTGTAALLLQKFPDLTPEQMKTRLNTRSAVGIDQRTGLPIRLLRAGAAVSPIVDLALGEALIQEEGIRVRWYVGKELGQASYLVYKAFEEDGPYQALSEFAIRGDNPYEILDVDAEPGRLHVYRVAVRDEAGLEEDLDTLRVAVPGIPQFTLRAPDPNPARDRVHLRFYLPASPAGGRVTVEAFDAMGRRVRDLGARLFSPGEEEHLVLWDLRGDDGRRVPAGMYFLRVTLEHGSRSVNGAARSLPAGPSSGVRRVVVLP